MVIGNENISYSRIWQMKIKDVSQGVTTYSSNIHEIVHINT